jgi:hypothetical protein
MSYEEMQKLTEILDRTKESKRIEEEIKHFDDRRANGAKISEFECSAIGCDETGTYEMYKITLRFNDDETRDE